MSRQQRHEIDRLLRSAASAIQPASIDQMREGFARFMGMFEIPDGVQRTPIKLAGRPAVQVDAQEALRPGTILYLHGGSFTLGSPETAMAITANLVRRTGVTALSLDYRLAPEHPFPAAIEDVLSAYRTLLDSGTDPATIAFVGDSAGGGLSVTTCLAARDAGLPMPAAIVGFSASLDHTRSGESMKTKAELDPLLNEATLAAGAELYLDGQDPNNPLLAPAVMADLSGLPPMLLQVGTNELLLDDTVRLAQRARAAEVDVILDITAGVPHVFQSFAATLDEADHALDRAALFLTQHLPPDDA